MFTVAEVKTNILQNHIANSVKLSDHETLEDAKKEADKVYNKRNEMTPTGYGLTHDIIVHDGKEVY